ncbi:MAG: hypothetical protein Q4A28_09820 [Brachymonas sp.]|nr:hypothetical protein [Brachymonas sp.]
MLVVSRRFTPVDACAFAGSLPALSVVRNRRPPPSPERRGLRRDSARKPLASPGLARYTGELFGVAEVFSWPRGKEKSRFFNP